MASPYDPEAVAQAMAGGVFSTLAGLRQENDRLKAEVSRLKAERQELVKTKLALTRERDEARATLAAVKEK